VRSLVLCTLLWVILSQMVPFACIVLSLVVSSVFSYGMVGAYSHARCNLCYRIHDVMLQNTCCVAEYML
jgi:hypothetical protein